MNAVEISSALASTSFGVRVLPKLLQISALSRVCTFFIRRRVVSEAGTTIRISWTLDGVMGRLVQVGSVTPVAGAW